MIKKISTLIKKLTLFDKLLILVAIACIAFFAYVFFRKSTYLTVTIKVGQDNVIYSSPGVQTWFSQLFRPDMKESDGLGKLQAEVLDVYQYDTSPTQRAVYLKTKLNVVFNRASNQYTYKGFPVLVGTTVKLNLDDLLVDGMVTHIEGMKDPRQNVKLLLKTQLREETTVFPGSSGTKSYIADAINIGDEVKDSNGKTIIKVVDKTVQKATTVVTTSDGRILTQEDPLRKDVFLTLEASAISVNGRYYVFDDIPVLVGFGIPVRTRTIEIWPEVTEILHAENVQ